MEMIGADLPYFENLTGPARNTIDNKKIYKVNNCIVEATIVKNTIQSLKLNLSNRCTFDLNKFIYGNRGKLPPPQKLTFGKFDSIVGEGNFYAGCLRGCGNAVDPSIYEHWKGAMAQQQIEVLLETTQMDDPILDAANLWEDKMISQESEEWVTQEKYNCTTKYDSLAHKLFRNARISAITVGYDLIKFSCL